MHWNNPESQFRRVERWLWENTGRAKDARLFMFGCLNGGKSIDADGAAELVRFAYNDGLGEYSIKVTDVATGLTGTRNVRIEEAKRKTTLRSGN